MAGIAISGANAIEAIAAVGATLVGHDARTLYLGGAHDGVLIGEPVVLAEVVLILAVPQLVVAGVGDDDRGVRSPRKRDQRQQTCAEHHAP